MKTKEQLKDEAWGKYKVIRDEAREKYEARLKEINAIPDEIPDEIIQNGKTYKLIK